LRDVLQLRYLAGNDDEARKLAQNLKQKQSSESSLSAAIRTQVAELENKKGHEADLDAKIKFVTGVKTEYYCQGKGLVELKAEHADGTKSHVVLLSSSRVMLDNSFAQMASGDWVYEFSDGYRSTSRSDDWIIASTPTSYEIKESRTRPNGTDSGDYKSNFKSPKHVSKSFGTQGDVKEPVPMFLAMDFVKWGNYDLGYKIQFKNGFADSQKASESGDISHDLSLLSNRKVGQKISKLTTTDATGTKRTYEECFPVTYNISVDKIEDRGLEITGDINKWALRSMVREHSPAIQSCYNQTAKQSGDFSGSITFVFTIDENGHALPDISHSRVNGDGGNAEQLSTCIRSVIQNLQFQAETGRKDVAVKYPMVFSGGKLE